MPEGMPQMKEDAPSTVGEAKERIVDTASEKTLEMREQARTKLRDQLQQRSTDVGRQLTSVGGAVNEAAQKLRDDGNSSAADLTERAGEKVSQLATYLEQADGDRMLRDLEELGRRQPMLAAAGGLALGFVASRFLKASSARRYRALNTEDAMAAPVTAPASAGATATTDLGATGVVTVSELETSETVPPTMESS
jgi:hypothetical protein